MQMVQRTHEGCVRELNEDSLNVVTTDSGAIVAILADGMGGHQAGEIASQRAVEALEQILTGQSLTLSIEEKGELLLKAVGKANETIYNLANENNEMTGMGTTTIAAIIDEQELVLAHVGDSRAYLLYEDGLYQLTIDHTYVELLKQYGQITEEEAKIHPQRNLVVRAVGTNESVDVDLINTRWEKGDTLLICSDGLTGMLSDREIGLVLTSTLTLEEQADELIQLSLDAGATDNVSLILIKHIE